MGIRPFAALALTILLIGCVSPPRPAPRRPVFVPPPPSRPPTATRIAPTGPMTNLAAEIRGIGQQFDGHVGIAVVRVADGMAVSFQGQEPFPQQSVSKLWVALATLNDVDNGRTQLDQTVRITPDDLTLFHQPIAEEVGDDGLETTVRDLLERAMTQSDNTANDRLLRLAGGPEAIRRNLSTKAITGVRFGPGERMMQSATAGLTWRQSLSEGGAFFRARSRVSAEERAAALDTYLTKLPDGAAPLSIAAALARLKRGELLSQNSTRLMLQLMNEAVTGKQRIAGGVPFDWRYGHKTGTGQEFRGRSTGYNDVGIMTAPDGSSYAVAVMVASTRIPIPERQAMMQAVAASIVASHRR
jgi:beta-lactamase class A